MPSELHIDVVDVATTNSKPPSLNCVLGVEPSTGRLKWCPNCKYIKCMLLLPAVMLPIIVFIILSVQLNLAQELKLLSQSRAYHMADNESIDVRSLKMVGLAQHQQPHQQHQQRQPLQQQLNCPRIIEHIPNGESFDTDEREILRDVRTSFIPADKSRRLLDDMYWCIGGDDNVVSDQSNNVPKQYHTTAQVMAAATADLISSPNDIIITNDATKSNVAINFNHNENNGDALDTMVQYRHRRRMRRHNMMVTIERNQNDTQQQEQQQEQQQQQLNNENVAANQKENTVDKRQLEQGRHSIVVMIENDSDMENGNGNRNRDNHDENNNNNNNATIGNDANDERIRAPMVFWNGETTLQQIRTNQMEIMKQYMDMSVKPCDDFYQYACGNWEKYFPIPRDKAGFDTFEILRESLDVVLGNLLTETDVENELPTEPSENLSVDAPAKIGIVATTPITMTYNEIISDEGNNNSIDAATVDEKLTSCTQNRSCDEQLQQNMFQGQETVTTVRRTAEEKAKSLFRSCMNDEILTKRGIEPLLNLLDRLGGWPVLMDDWNASAFDWIQLAGELRLYNNDVFIMEWVGPDIKNSNEYIIQFDQTSLGLPTREYFLQTSNIQYLEAYQEYIYNVVIQLGGRPEKSAKVASEIVEFETSLARIMAAPEERNNVSQLYNRLTIESLHAEVPGIDWQRYLEILLERQVDTNETVVMFAMKFMQDLTVLLNNTDQHTIANYMFWKFVRHRINNLDDRFKEAKERFYMMLLGREQSPPRWKTCVNQVNSNMGMAVGAMFVRRYFNEQSKQDTMAMTKELQDSFRSILNETNWIDANTKQLAELKVSGMSLKIGYPDFILNPDELDAKYDELEINDNEYFENVLRILQYLTRTEQNKLAESVNKTAWNTAPAIVNAYYSRNKNQIMFPAGILQPPFYHRHFPRSLNFGGIGVVIGHELTHGFDDKGRLFDREGNLNRWWSEKSILGFHQRASCLVTQYGNYTMSELGGLAIDGSITQGENIADNGGIKQAFRAYQKWLSEHCNNAECLQHERMPGIDLNHLQLFFLNFAQVWCGAMRPEATKNKMKTAVHSPGRFRVIGTLSNSDDFASVFGCSRGTPMNPTNKCSVW